MHLNARRIYREMNETHFILLAIEDVTDRKRAQEALRESFEKLRFFAYSVIHVLRSPTIDIYGLIEFLHKHCSVRYFSESPENSGLLKGEETCD
jgi:PAS domain-containing protein